MRYVSRKEEVTMPSFEVSFGVYCSCGEYLSRQTSIVSTEPTRVVVTVQPGRGEVRVGAF